ncbi:MAG: DUF3160 domain-containing protein [Bacillota bacterium]
MRIKGFIVFLFIIITLVGTIFISGCSTSQPKDNNQIPKEENNPVQPGQPAQPEESTNGDKGKFILQETISAEFATYEGIGVSYKPSVELYNVENGLNNIINKDMFHLSPAAQQLLVESGFVVVPAEHREFFPLYEINRYEPVPSFVTTDSVMHNYHLFFSHLLRVIEKEKLSPELKKLTESMLSQSARQYQELKDTQWENAAKRNMGFFAVAGKILNPDLQIPDVVAEEVNKELKLIQKHEGIDISPVMNLGQQKSIADYLQEDYSQYIPRGHYDTDALRDYFQTMMWYGRLTFRLKSADETRSAVLITLALSKDINLSSWDKIYQPTKFFVGQSDDITYEQYRKILVETYGSEIDLEMIVTDENKWQEFREKAGKLSPPKINSMPIFDESINPDREKEITGFRFMGQRFTLDAAIFQRLVYREVGDLDHRRMLPKALDIPAAFGSQEAYSILDSLGETKYKNYPENMLKLQKFVSELDEKTWTQNLYWGWLYSLQPLIEEKGEGYPAFMRNSAWRRKELTTFLGSWTELKHDTILYAKQVYAEMGGGDIGDDRGYVEPNPELYARVASLVKMTREGLLQRELLNTQDEESLKRLEQLALSLKIISEKELSGILPSDEEFELIRSYGGQLEHFWLEALKDEGIEHRSALMDRPAALVADVATNPEGLVLEEATGHIFEIYAIVPVEGKLRITKGGVYSHYEFPWPLNDRLTDEKWRSLLDNGQAPALAEWTKDYIANEQP